MIKLFSFFLCLIICNKAIATDIEEALICDKDGRGFIFVTEDNVKVLHISLSEFKIISITHSYQLAEYAILIKKPSIELYRYKKSKIIGWIFRKNLDYVLLYNVNEDWNRKFLWSCKKNPSDLLKQKLKNKIDHFMKVGKNKKKDFS